MNLDPVFYLNVAKIVYLLERNIKVTTITFQKGLSNIAIREEGTEEQNQNDSSIEVLLNFIDES